ncbi:MAG: hydroxyacid dehydrogenase [Alphaproteobacteria bacterium CG_4_9_14_3_um_filter_47_13]|nr:MAG: hydroxyacid dehydrogenase [Alphaproteobacteria bacterium CG_4_9_14_3_um_filter_47_13]
MQKILITTSSFDLELPEIKTLRESGYEVVLNPYGRRLTEAEIRELLTPDIVGLIAGLEPLTKAVIDAAPHLRVISRCGIGMDNVDLAAAKAQGIQVFNTPDAPTKAVAELAMGLILDALRGISAQDRKIRAGEWQRPMGGLLGARTLGLIGFGRIGRKVAEYAQAFGAEIIMHDPFATDNPHYVAFDDLLAQADIISLHIPYSKESHHLIDRKALAKMKRGSILVNTARGGLVDEQALAEALQSGHLAGASLDVYAQEPYQGILTDIENITLTAHVGSYAQEARTEQEALAARNMLIGLQDEAGARIYG